MANINLTVNVLDGAGCPVLSAINTTNLAVIINGAEYDTTNPVIEAVPQDTTVTLFISKTGYDSYIGSIDVTSVDQTINVILNESAAIEPVTIVQTCHSYTITNTGTTSDDDVTYTVTDLDSNVITDYLNISIPFGESNTFASSEDGVYLLIVRDVDEEIIRNYVIIDICNILACYTSRLLTILCPDCDCEDCQDYCKKDYDMKRINLLFFDLFNRINREYRLNSYYTIVDDAKITELTTTQEDIDKLSSYCSTCGGDTSVNSTSVLNITNSTSNSDCGCS